MKDFILAISLMGFAFVALAYRATHEPYDYRKDLLNEGGGNESLSFALEEALKKEKSAAPTAPGSSKH